MNANEALISYLKYRKYDNIGFIKYGNFKKIISFVLDCNNDYYIRKLFLSLIDNNYLIKKKILKKVIYINLILTLKLSNLKLL